MNNNELYTHKRSDTIKWIIAFTLIVVLLAGMIGAWVVLLEDKPVDEDPVQEQEQQTVVTDGEGNAMESGKVYAMPMNMVFATTAAEPSNASDGITLTAKVKPESADDKTVDWSVSFADPSSSWASGKTVTDYVTVTPVEDGSLTANVQCLKAFGERIKITVTSRANAYAKAECTLDYARRIIDTALYSEDRDTLALEFGSDEVLVDLVIPSYDDFITSLHDGTLWAGDYGAVWLYHGMLTDEELNDPWTNWADEDVGRTFRFSDYTIKDNLLVAPENGVNSEYVTKIESTCEVASEIRDLYCNFATQVTMTKYDGAIFSFQDLFRNGYEFGNNPLAILAAQDGWEAFAGMPDFTEELYYEYMEDFVNWFRENPDTPIAEYTVTYTGKYSTFTRRFSFRYNPDTVQMPVFALEMDETTIVI